MSDLNNEIREPEVQEQVHPEAEVVNEEKNPILEGVKAKLDPIVEDVREKIDPVVEDVKSKAAPVIDKVKTAAEDAIDAVKEGAEKVGDFFSADLPGINVKNDLFDELETQVKAQKDAAKSKAEEMQALLEKMMGKK